MAESGATKKLLADSLRELIHEQGFAGITVGDICKKSGLNRKSFYYHFRDKYDLVCWIFYTDFFDTFCVEDGEDAAPDTLKSLCRFLQKDRQFYKAILRVEGQNSLQEYLGDVLKSILSERLEKRFGADPDWETYVDLHVSLWVSTLCRWVTEGCRLEADHLVRILYNASASIGEAKP